MNTELDKIEIDPRNNWEKAIDGKNYSVRFLSCVFENVVPKMKIEGEFPAQTLRRLFLQGTFTPRDLLHLRMLGRKGIDFLLLQLGLAATTDGRFIESV